MSSKERVCKALAHESGKVPIDFGGSVVTGMHVSCVEALREHYGLELRPVRVVEPYQMLGEIDEELKSAIGVDVDGIFPWHNIFGFPDTDWKEWETPWGQLVLVPGKFFVTESDGDYLLYPQGDTSALPSAKMPGGGFYFDSIIRQKPVVEEELKAEDNLEEFQPVSEEELEYIRRQRNRAARSERAVFATLVATAIGDISGVPGPGLTDPKGIRDVTEWYISTVTRQDLLHEIFSRQVDVALANLEKIHAIIGDTIDVLYVCGTDFGTQTSAFCSVGTYDSLYAPYHRRVNKWVHDNTSWKTFKHSCGAVEQFMAHFIDAGFDIINPVQCSAAGMEPRHLKAEYGEHLVFWGGGVDTQKTLPFGTPEEVRKQVLERCEIFAESGGYVFQAIHNVQANTPTENIVAMIDAVHEFNGE